MDEVVKWCERELEEGDRVVVEGFDQKLRQGERWLGFTEAQQIRLLE